MKICRFNHSRIGVVEGDVVYDITAVLSELPIIQYPVPLGDHLYLHMDQVIERMPQLMAQADRLSLTEVALTSPVANPSKIIGTPSNYMAHRIEAGADKEISVYSKGKRRPVEEQGLFLKANSSLIGPSDGVKISMPERRTDHEGEIAIVIGRQARSVSPEQAMDYVHGYALALDMVVRGPEDRSFRKSVDTFSVLGPWVVSRDDVGAHDDINFRLLVNGEERQAANTSQMLMNIPKQIAWASQFYTLYPGDIIMTGTCQGVGPVQAGDTIRVEAEAIGTMDVPVS